jgi:hypothetical protein
MAPGPRKELSSDEELASVIDDFEKLAREIDSAIRSLSGDPGSEEAVDRLEKAKAAALRGAGLVRGKLNSN